MQGAFGIPGPENVEGRRMWTEDMAGWDEKPVRMPATAGGSARDGGCGRAKGVARMKGGSKRLSQEVARPVVLTPWVGRPY